MRCAIGILEQSRDGPARPTLSRRVGDLFYEYIPDFEFCSDRFRPGTGVKQRFPHNSLPMYAFPRRCCRRRVPKPGSRAQLAGASELGLGAYLFPPGPTMLGILIQQLKGRSGLADHNVARTGDKNRHLVRNWMPKPAAAFPTGDGFPAPVHCFKATADAVPAPTPLDWLPEISVLPISRMGGRLQQERAHLVPNGCTQWLRART